MSNYTWQEWAWLCLFAGGAFYMVGHLSYLFGRWFWPKVMPTRYTIPIGLGDEQNRVRVWAYSLERAIIKAAAKDGYQYIVERLGWTPMHWQMAWPQNLKWLTWQEWRHRREYRRYTPGDADELLVALIEIYGEPGRNCWANRRNLWLLCLRSAELEAKNPTGMEHQTIKKTCIPSTGSEKGAKLQEILPDQFDPDTRTCQMNPEQRAQAATVENMAGKLVGSVTPAKAALHKMIDELPSSFSEDDCLFLAAIIGSFSALPPAALLQQLHVQEAPMEKFPRLDDLVLVAETEQQIQHFLDSSLTTPEAKGLMQKALAERDRHKIHELLSSKNALS